MPSILFSLPDEKSILLELDHKEAARHVRRFGRNGILARPMQLDIQDDAGGLLGSCRVLPRNVHVNAQTLNVENITLMFCPKERRLKVPVPITLWNEEVAPGLKKGGWLHVVNRTVTFRCTGAHIPPLLELDMREMDVHDIMRYQDLPLPPGCELAVKDKSQPVVRCALKVGD